MKQDERQVSPTLDGIRRDHVARYEFAAKQIKKQGARVIDFACGVGYGSKILADQGHFVSAFDVDEEALAYGRQHYGGKAIEYAAANGNTPQLVAVPNSADVAVCFETIEHLEDPRPLLLALREASPVLIASVPNEAVMPFAGPDNKGTKYHFRHYLKNQFNELLRECGWDAFQWFGQMGPESEVEKNVDGRTLIVTARRAELPDATAVAPRKHIAIIGLGPSAAEFLNKCKRAGGRSAFCDEVWGVNAIGNVFDCDLVFHMDDVRIQEIRAAAAPASNIAAMLKWIKTSQVPVVTSRLHPDYPALVAFPLEAVLNHFGHDYFNTTVAYAVVLAMHVGATEISCFGMDFTYANVHDAEKGRACVEFWLGQAHARGIKIGLPAETTLMDACYGSAGRLYGYDTTDVVFKMQPDGTVKLDFIPREKLPTAAEIERNYDHSRPVTEQHRALKAGA